MDQGTHEHLEHAEHTEHAAHNPFDRQVAMTITIIAAVLAVVAMLSHRGHNETLLLQSKANVYHTKASDAWNFYQAKNIRSGQYQIALGQDLTLTGKSAQDAERFRQGLRNYWTTQVDKYEGEGFWTNMQETDFTPKKTRGGKKIKSGELAKLQGEAKEYQHKAEHLEEESHHVHYHVVWLDYGHLGLELALVLCSVAILTKERNFWRSGVVIAAFGAVLALYGVYGLYLAPH